MAEAYQPRDSLYLWWLAEPAMPRLIGEVRLTGGGRTVALQYTGEWIATGIALSEDLPLTNTLFVPADKDCAAGAVEDARPDRWGERVIRKFERSPRMSILEYLLFAGVDRFGALGVSQSAEVYAPWPTSPISTLASLDEIALVVKKVLANEPVTEIERRLVRPGVSMGGARPKSIVSIDGEPWLVKFSDGDDLDMELIEHATMLLAKRCGIEAAPTRAIKLASGGHAVAVQRFDRIRGNRIGERRVHAISAYVALRAAGEQYGYPQLAELLRRLSPSADIERGQAELFRRMVFNILMDNTDDHEKNHALLRQDNGGQDNGRYLLSPAFDIAPCAQGLGYQAIVVGDNGVESSLENALSQVSAFGMKEAAGREILREVATVVVGWKEHFREVSVIDAHIDILSQYIDGPHLGLQRRDAIAASNINAQGIGLMPVSKKPC